MATPATGPIPAQEPAAPEAASPAAVANSSMGRSVAVGPTAAAFCLVGAETPTGSLGTVYPFEFRIAQVPAVRTYVKPAPVLITCTSVAGSSTDGTAVSKPGAPTTTCGGLAWVMATE